MQTFLGVAAWAVMLFLAWRFARRIIASRQQGRATATAAATAAADGGTSGATAGITLVLNFGAIDQGAAAESRTVVIPAEVLAGRQHTPLAEAGDARQLDPSAVWSAPAAWAHQPVNGSRPAS